MLAFEKTRLVRHPVVVGEPSKVGGGRGPESSSGGGLTEGNTSSPHTRDRRSYDGWRRSCSPRLGEDQDDGEGKRGTEVGIEMDYTRCGAAPERASEERK